MKSHTDRKEKPSGQECKVCGARLCGCEADEQGVTHFTCGHFGHIQPPKPPLQGKQDWEELDYQIKSLLHTRITRKNYKDLTEEQSEKIAIKDFKKYIQSAIHKTEKRMIEEIEKTMNEFPTGHPLDEGIIEIYKEDWEIFKKLLTHSSQKE